MSNLYHDFLFKKTGPCQAHDETAANAYVLLGTLALTLECNWYSWRFYLSRIHA